MDLTLLKMWNGLPIGFRMVGVQVGQAELMILHGTAIATSPVESKQNQNIQQRDKGKRG